MCAGGDIHDADDRLFGATLGELVRQAVTLFARLPPVESGGPRGVDLHRVDERPFGPVSFDHEQDGVLLVSGAPHHELSVTAPHRNRDQARRRPDRHTLAHPVLPRPRRAHLLEERVLGVRPRLGARVVGVLEPAIGVGDLVAVEVVDDVEALGGG